VEVIDEAEDGPVELRFEAKGSGFTVWAGDAIVAAASGRPDRRVFAVNVQLDSRCDRGVAGRVLAEVEAIAAVPDAVVDMGNPVLRDEARRRGWTGPLRGPLTMGRPAGDETVAAAVSALIGRPVSTGPARDRRRLFNTLRFGYGAALRLTVAEPGLTVTVPNGADLMVESVARAIDTVLAVRERFGSHAGHLRVVSFDRVSHGAGPARWAGLANQTVFSIHLNESLALAGGWVRLRRQRETAPLRRPSADVRHPFGAIDGVSAHEAWHQIEFKFRGRIADHSAFRRELGAVLGVETLEQAIQGRHRGAPEAFRLAHDRLLETVSPYATTNPLEAAAEMFKLWWCGVSNPTIDCFGALLDRFFALGPR